MRRHKGRLKIVMLQISLLQEVSAERVLVGFLNWGSGGGEGSVHRYGLVDTDSFGGLKRGI
jgi:hypothetical protein